MIITPNISVLRKWRQPLSYWKGNHHRSARYFQIYTKKKSTTKHSPKIYNEYSCPHSQATTINKSRTSKEQKGRCAFSFHTDKRTKLVNQFEIPKGVLTFTLKRTGAGSKRAQRLVSQAAGSDSAAHVLRHDGVGDQRVAGGTEVLRHAAPRHWLHWSWRHQRRQWHCHQVVLWQWQRSQRRVHGHSGVQGRGRQGWGSGQCCGLRGLGPGRSRDRSNLCHALRVLQGELRGHVAVEGNLLREVGVQVCAQCCGLHGRGLSYAGQTQRHRWRQTLADWHLHGAHCRGLGHTQTSILLQEDFIGGCQISNLFLQLFHSFAESCILLLQHLVLVTVWPSGRQGSWTIPTVVPTAWVTIQVPPPPLQWWAFGAMAMAGACVVVLIAVKPLKIVLKVVETRTMIVVSPHITRVGPPIWPHIIAMSVHPPAQCATVIALGGVAVMHIIAEMAVLALCPPLALSFHVVPAHRNVQVVVEAITSTSLGGLLQPWRQLACLVELFFLLSGAVEEPTRRPVAASILIVMAKCQLGLGAWAHVGFTVPTVGV